MLDGLGQASDAGMIAVSDYRTQMDEWNEYEDGMGALGVPLRFPHVPKDDPRFAKVEKIMAKFGGGPPPAPLPPGWEGPRPVCYDATLEWLEEYLFGGMFAKDGDEGYPRGGPILHYSRVIRNAHHALHWFGLYHMAGGVPNGTPKAASVNDGLGQIQDLLAFVRGKIAEGWKRPRREMIQSPEGSKTGPRRSWTQRDLDQAVWQYKAARADTYSKMAQDIKAGRKGAKATAESLFGRKAIVEAMRVRCPSMVSKSPPWREMADELGLRRGPGAVARMKTPDFDMILATTNGSGNDPQDEVARRETIRSITRKLVGNEHRTAREAILTQLETGKITDEKALEAVDICLEQHKDDETTRRGSQRPCRK